MWTLIAGAGSGIGNALARQLAGRGEHLILAGRTAAKLHGLADDCRRLQPQCQVLVHTADFSRLHEVKELTREVRRATDTLGGLVYCAGEGDPAADLRRWDVADLNRALTVNVAAPLAMIQGLADCLHAGHPAARIAMLGAGLDETVQQGTGSYGISKMALRRLVRQLAVEFDASARAPVISLFQPGLVDTGGLRSYLARAAQLGLPHVAWIEQRLADGACLTAEQAASALAYTLSDVPESDFHGAVFHGRDLVDSLSFSAS